MKHTLFFTPKDKKYNFEKPEFFKHLPALLPEIRHIMTITEFRNNRSANQNAYMWGVVYKMIAEETGFFPDEVHQEMGKQFLSYENHGKQFVKSTTKLNTKDMEIYLQRVRMLASEELDLTIPLPNEPDQFYYEVK